MDAQAGVGRVDLGLRKRPKAEVVAFGKCMAALETLRSKDALIGFQIEVYEDVTADVPIAILIDAVRGFLGSGEWRPTPPELLRACERARLERRKAMQYLPCAVCEQSPGWAAVVEDGKPKVTRCQCWKAHQVKLAELGAGHQPLALPQAETEDAA
jgi:hypothetical protein